MHVERIIIIIEEHRIYIKIKKNFKHDHTYNF